MNDLDVYTHNEIDVDLSNYRVINADVKMYRGGNNAIDTLLSRYSSLIDKSVDVMLYIKGNRLFFTVNGVKYWHILTCWANEWQFIDSLISDLSLIAENVAYKPGELD